MDAPAAHVIRIESREHLLSTLAEAAELEHTVMCVYLYAVFSLKQSRDEGLSSAELVAVTRWRGLLMEVAIQEMTHLVLVTNLMTSIGGTAHFYRPGFPVQQGCFPAEFVVGLAPFSLETLDQFILLERPDDRRSAVGQEPQRDTDYVRTTSPGRLMAHPGDYHTVGQLYEAVEQGIERLSRDLKARDLFCGCMRCSSAHRTCHSKACGSYTTRPLPSPPFRPLSSRAREPGLRRIRTLRSSI
ncbi:MAG: hypothetical protein H0X01_05535 [Nitrospira sp.]|nr:hypothetical protein [Nitrospira sp.]